MQNCIVIWWIKSGLCLVFHKMKRVRVLSLILLILIMGGQGCSNNETRAPGIQNTSQSTHEPQPESTRAPTQTVAEQTPIVNLPHLSDTISAILSHPASYVGQQVEIVGYFRGWDLLKELNSPPPVTRSDWVVVDLSGAIYVTGILPSNLDPASPKDTDKLIRLVAKVEQNQNGVYLRALSVEMISTE